jgi:hypothetical protein
MATEWTKCQREGWLAQLYGQEQSHGKRVLQSDTVQSRQLDIIDDLISFRVSATDAASRAAALVLSHAAVDTIWLNTIGMFINAAETIDDEKVSAALTDFLVELASLPDAVNPGPEAMTADDDGQGKPLRIEPGQAVILQGGKLWKDLPQYSWNVTETFQGEHSQIV